MDTGIMITIGRLSILQVLTLAGPVLIVAVTVGLVISILQAITSIQEQTLTFVPKIVAILLVIIFLGPWMIARMIGFTEELWRQMITI